MSARLDFLSMAIGARATDSSHGIAIVGRSKFAGSNTPSIKWLRSSRELGFIRVLAPSPTLFGESWNLPARTLHPFSTCSGRRFVPARYRSSTRSKPIWRCRRRISRNSLFGYSGSRKTTRCRRRQIVLDLPGIKLYNQLLIHNRRNLFTGRNPHNFTLELILLRDQPIWHRLNLSKLKVASDQTPRTRFIFDSDSISRFQIVRSDVHLSVVHRDVSVIYQLASCVARIRESKSINYIIEPGLQHLQQGFTGDAAFSQSRLKITAELTFEQAILMAQFLLLGESGSVI